MPGVAGKKVKEGTGALLVPGYMMDYLEKSGEPTQVQAYMKDGRSEAEIQGDLSSIIVLGTALLAHIALNVKDAHPDTDPNKFINAVAVSAKQIVNDAMETEGEHYDS